MNKIYNLSLILILVGLLGCNKENDAPATGVLKGTVSDAQTAGSLENAHVIIFDSNTNAPVKSLKTNAEGNYNTTLIPGSYYIKLYKQGYENVPPRNISPIPFTVVVDTEVNNPVKMHGSKVTNGGFISGKITETGKEVPGVLVVGEKDGIGYSSISDEAGNYFIYNLPEGSYKVKGWLGGYQSEEKTVNITTSTESKENIILTKGATGSVTGTLSFLATTAIEVDVALTHPLTEEAIPGLSTKTLSNYTIENVPTGPYLARATFQNDERVVDPDWIVKFGEPFVEVNTTASTRNFSLTNSVLLTEPTNSAATTIPLTINGATPTFTWAPYSSASDYVIEVTDASGNVIWGGFDRSQAIPVKNIIIPSSQTSIEFNSDGKASANLEAGQVYRWKIYASKNDNQATSGWKLISVSEDQLGLIKIFE